MNAQILENERVKYQVRLNGQVLTTASSQQLAESFVTSLDHEKQKLVEIIPITGSGQQILMG
ncbi:MAG: hypothetical protein DRI46_12975 [Chloroflexi bacterium]|nr:MAG: hypothetical protein DRI46_12975 [Chloroflexota bacterium]